MKLTSAFVVLACVLFSVAAAMPAIPRAQDKSLYIGDTDIEAREPVLDWAYEKRSDTNEGLEKRGISYNKYSDELEDLEGPN